MKTARLLGCVAVIAVCTESIAIAWSGPGHAAVAVMAYRELAAEPALRANLVSLLEHHPKFPVWNDEYSATKGTLPKSLDFGMFLFVRAATWPDEIRRTKIESLQRFDHPDWHYVDYPLDPPAFGTGPSPQPENDVLFGIGESLKTLAQQDADPVDRAAALSWLIHLVGDIHQPLHCSTLVTATFPLPDGDEGGNKFLIFQTADHKKSGLKTKLHTYWDSRLGSDLVPSPVQALQNAKMLLKRFPRVSLSELAAGDDTAQWSFESRDTSIANVYQFKGKMLREKEILPVGYITNSHRVARKRLALAGYRLSDELRKAVF